MATRYDPAELAECYAIVGNQTSRELQSLIKMLAFNPRHNTPEDNERLSAARYIQQYSNCAATRAH